MYKSEAEKLTKYYQMNHLSNRQKNPTDSNSMIPNKKRIYLCSLKRIRNMMNNIINTFNTENTE